MILGLGSRYDALDSWQVALGLPGIDAEYPASAMKASARWFGEDEDLILSPKKWSVYITRRGSVADIPYSISAFGYFFLYFHHRHHYRCCSSLLIVYRYKTTPPE